MKKFSILMAGLAMSGTAFAQTSDEPNRLIMNYPGGMGGKSFSMEYIDYLSFDRIDGDVKAEIEIHTVDRDQLSVSITRSEACEGFLIDVMAAPLARQLADPVRMISYMEDKKLDTYYEDFDHGNLSGISLQPNGEYCIVTVGIDRLGTLAGVAREYFKVPGLPTVGNPQVAAEQLSCTKDSFTIKFTPNADTSSYYTVAAPKGQMQSQFDMFGAMFGATCMEDLVKMWGIENTGETTKTWDDMDPSEIYEVYILPLDVEDNYGVMTIFEATTETIGGYGEAKVDVVIGKYELADWNGEMLPSQYITFTPNDQAKCYRMSVYPKQQFDDNHEDIIEYICSDPEIPTAYWFFFEPMTTDFQLSPDTEYVAIAAAKNLNNEWGPVTEVAFTTPSSAAEPSGVRSERIGKPEPLPVGPGTGMAPTMVRKQLKLTARAK